MTGVYTVFAVEAGDRLTLGATVDGEYQTKPVMLSFVQCPRLGRRTEQGYTQDEPCAADAHEFTRSMVIGKQVLFTEVEYVEPLERGSGTVALQDGTSLTEGLLKAGLANLARTPGLCPKTRYDELQAMAATARSGKKGVHSPEARHRVRKVVPHSTQVAEHTAATQKGKTLKLRVERVVTGTKMLLANIRGNEWQQLQADFTGVAAKKDDPVARLHTERLLLHRTVSVVVDGVDNFGVLLVSLLSPKGTFQEDLLAKGLARVHAPTVDKGDYRTAFIAAEKAAQRDQRGIWAASEPVKPATVIAAVTNQEGEPAAAALAPFAEKAPVVYSGETDFLGSVVQIVTGDMLLVRRDTDAAHIKVSLAGVRAPRNIKRDTQSANGGRPAEARASYDEYTWECREFLRRRFIGAAVTVRVEYARRIEETKEVRPMCTVMTDKGENIAAAVLSAGLAKFFLGRSDECSTATELATCEVAAVNAKRGLHSGQPSATTKITELNRIGEKQGRYYLSFFQRGMVGKRPPTWKAVVEACLSGSSLRVYVPREHCQFTLRMAGVVSPSSGINGEAADPMAAESKDFAVRTLQQREVDIMVETVDRGGNFIGYVSIDGKNFATSLLAEGLATVSGADRTLNGGELTMAQRAAQQNNKGLWALGEGAIPAMAKRRDAQDAARNKPKATFEKPAAADAEWAAVHVTDVQGPTAVSIVQADDSVEATREAMAEVLATFASNGAKSHQPKRGEAVAVLFREDKSWNRGKVVDVSVSDRRATVQYIDFGNTDEVAFKDLRAIPADAGFDLLRTTAPLAQTVALAYLKPVPGEDAQDYADDAVSRAWEYIGEPTKTLYARVEYTSDQGKTKCYTVSNAPSGSTLQQALLRDGLAVLEREAVPLDPMAAAKFSEAMEVARREHRNAWRFGDIDGSDDDE